MAPPDEAQGLAWLSIKLQQLLYADADILILGMLAQPARKVRLDEAVRQFRQGRIRQRFGERDQDGFPGALQPFDLLESRIERALDRSRGVELVQEVGDVRRLAALLKQVERERQRRRIAPIALNRRAARLQCPFAEAHVLEQLRTIQAVGAGPRILLRDRLVVELERFRSQSRVLGTNILRMPASIRFTPYIRQLPPLIPIIHITNVTLPSRLRVGLFL